MPMKSGFLHCAPFLWDSLCSLGKGVAVDYNSHQTVPIWLYRQVLMGVVIQQYLVGAWWPKADIYLCKVLGNDRPHISVLCLFHLPLSLAERYFITSYLSTAGDWPTGPLTDNSVSLGINSERRDPLSSSLKEPRSR